MRIRRTTSMCGGRRRVLYPCVVALVLGTSIAGESHGQAEAGAPPVLLDRKGAREYAKKATGSGDQLRTAEIALLAGDAEGALAALESFTPENPDEGARKTRLELDANVALGRRRIAEDRATELEAHEGWGAHAFRQRMRAETHNVQQIAGTVGTLMFALALAFLVLAAARELFRIDRETVVFGLLAAISVLIAQSTSPVGAGAIGILGIATLSLVHAATAAKRRVMPGARGRILFVALLLLGMCGAAAAVVSRLELSYVITALS